MIVLKNLNDVHFQLPSGKKKKKIKVFIWNWFLKDYSVFGKAIVYNLYRVPTQPQQCMKEFEVCTEKMQRRNHDNSVWNPAVQV